MLLTQLNLHDFRNVKSATLAPAEGVNLLLGCNGSGKTSVLEAIHYLGYGRSFRAHRTQRVIRHGQPGFTLYGKLCTQEQQSELSVGMQRQRSGEHLLKIDGERADSFAQLARLLPVQLIEPEGYGLLNGGPGQRRAFIDWGMFYQDSDFFPLWKTYQRLLKQRNALLKQRCSYSELSYWDQQLVGVSESLSDKRQKYCDELIVRLIGNAQFFLPEYQLTVNFFAGWERDKALSELLHNQFERDRQFGYTNLGAHKADLRLKANGIPVGDILSRGQLKLLVCAMRLAQGELLAHQCGHKCIYLIDDFASELDSDKRHLLMERLQQNDAQIFITAIDLDQLDAELVAKANKVFHVKQGEISEQS